LIAIKRRKNVLMGALKAFMSPLNAFMGLAIAFMRDMNAVLRGQRRFRRCTIS
jgi:hypothetical protein